MPFKKVFLSPTNKFFVLFPIFSQKHLEELFKKKEMQGDFSFEVYKNKQNLVSFSELKTFFKESSEEKIYYKIKKILLSKLEALSKGDNTSKKEKIASWLFENTQDAKTHQKIPLVYFQEGLSKKRESFFKQPLGKCCKELIQDLSRNLPLKLLFETKTFKVPLALRNELKELFLVVEEQTLKNLWAVTCLVEDKKKYSIEKYYGK